MAGAATASPAFPEAPILTDWPLRPWLLAGLLGLAGLLIHLFSNGEIESPIRAAMAAFVLFGALAAAFTLDRENWREPAIFSGAVGLLMAALAGYAVAFYEARANTPFAFAAGVLAVVLAVPLFQARFHRMRLMTPYAAIHFHVWTDAVSAGGALLFTGIAWAVLLMLAALFVLLQIDLLENLLGRGWFAWTVSGIAFGAALGVLRNQLKVIGTLQAVVLLVLSLLAVPLAFALVLFLLATALSGPEVLWSATASATPILLVSAAGAFVLAHAIVRQDDAAASSSLVMRIAGLALVIGILPLSAFAAASMIVRVTQHGLTPERLWGLAAIVVACAVGVGCWVAVIRGRWNGWPAAFRRATFELVLFTFALAILLALPILDFGRIATASQIERLTSGEVDAERFDFSALRWDFGNAGRAALTRLAASGDPRIAGAARQALAQKQRPFRVRDEAAVERRQRRANLRIQSGDPRLRAAVEAYIDAQPWECVRTCTALDLGPSAKGRRIALVQGDRVEQLVLQADGIVASLPPPLPPRRVQTGDEPRVEVRPFDGRQIYVDGRPIGEPFK
ncbi:DUF4153 domain-containing protein [Altericroceibacterium xinjiangense]|uniref:DUF4153 domain-containing protein n=1 Tax=Altericroceibacterium xinjiangense TaxID=762261 RepID=UPI000F7EB04D|nr:DUF4153 domain-containing protein [Altericroceibacterium xinjiangense]